MIITSAVLTVSVLCWGSQAPGWGGGSVVEGWPSVHNALGFLSGVQERETRQSRTKTSYGMVSFTYSSKPGETNFWCLDGRKGAGEQLWLLGVLFLSLGLRVWWVPFVEMLCVLFYTHVRVQFVFSLSNGNREG